MTVLSSEDDLSSGDDLSKLTPEQIATGKITWHLLNKAWPYDQRPPYLRKRNIIYQNTLEVWLGYMKQVDSLEKKKNLGKEVFAKDGKPEKIHFKAKTDNGVNKLHLARTLRLPVAHPKHWFKIIPKKRDEIVRNFPMDHLGLTGHIPDDVIGKLHNRSVKITLDLFCKSTHHEAVGSQKAGKYSDINQIRAGINHFCLALHCIWPYDYTGLVITEVLNEAHWAEEVTSDQRKRGELITELFNTVMADNSAKAVYNMYPLIYEQVLLLIFLMQRKSKPRTNVDLSKQYRVNLLYSNPGFVTVGLRLLNPSYNSYLRSAATLHCACSNISISFARSIDSFQES